MQSAYNCVEGFVGLVVSSFFYSCSCSLDLEFFGYSDFMGAVSIVFLCSFILLSNLAVVLDLARALFPLVASRALFPVVASTIDCVMLPQRQGNIYSCLLCFFMILLLLNVPTLCEQSSFASMWYTFYAPDTTKAMKAVTMLPSSPLD